MSDRHLGLAKDKVESAEPAAARSSATTSAPIAAGGLLVGAAGDNAEARADELADRALQRLSIGGESAGADPHSHDADCGHVHRMAAPAPSAKIGAAGGELDDQSTARIESMRGRGKSLDGSVRSSMESAFGTSFAGVRVHDGPDAAALSSAMSAAAFTTGRDIFFGAGQFDPKSPQGQRVLAHELGHVASEGGPSVRRGLLDRFNNWRKERSEKSDKVAESKQLQAQEKEDNAEARKEGMQGRADLQELIQNGGDPLTGQTPAERFKEVSLALAAGIKEEQDEVNRLLTQHKPGGVWDQGWDEDRVADQAFRTVYFDGPKAEYLKFVAPARATAQERLVRLVRQFRTDANVRKDAENMSKRGAASGDEKLDALYDQVAVKLNEEITAAVGAVDVSKLDAPAANQAKSDARRDVVRNKTKSITADVRAAAPPELQAKLPTADSAREIYYVNAAMQRFTIRGGNGTPDKEPETFDGFIEKWEKYGGYAEQGGSAAGLLAKGLGAITPEGSKTDDTDGLKVTDGPKGLKSVPIIGEFGQAVAQAEDRVKQQKTLPPNSSKSFKKDNDLFEKGETLNDRVTSGIGSGISILTKLKDAVLHGMKTVKAIRDGVKEKNPRKALETIKSASDGLSSLTEGAKSAAELAQKIDPGVKESVGKVIPGFDITLAALAIVSNAMSLADASIHLSDTNTAIQSARIRGVDGGKKKVDVMVYPLTKVAQSHTIKVEQAAWSTGKSVSDLITSISSLASGGGFGIPKAIEAGVGLLDTLHNFAHLVAKEVLIAQAKLTERESKLSLEGSAEAVLSKNPSMAVEGIILRAAKNDDQVAITFLQSFRVDGTPVPDLLPALKAVKPNDIKSTAGDISLLFKVRDAVLESMGDDADPQGMFDKAKSTYGKLKDINKMRKERNEMEGNIGLTQGRSWFWNVKMMLRSDEKTARSKMKTQIDFGEFQDSQAQPVTTDPKKVPSGPIRMIVGDLILPVGASDDVQDKFLKDVEKLDLKVIEDALTHPFNDDKARALLLTIKQGIEAAQSAKSAPAKVGA
ncbi:hypothetical protein GCM10010401_13000 [Rarobacter faecitabidus]|uniref:Uncharacterized protein DUF4157 n=1 Tax=Rarobacter faecitabidus TaxID=13243 RepID=A0A542ZEC8_RARFA|nr:DUF4157 domain-containing protein [Rarobacter faecitabidus]TQL58651.1 uncharacterized protein DUF4157 [Rarobacter faecitabidus]